MKTVTVQQLAQVLANVNSAQPFGLSSLTEPALAKPAPFAIRKLSRVSGFIANWESLVNNQLAREGKEKTFEASPRKWGRHVSLALVEHKGAHYLSTKVQHAKPVFLVKQSPQSPWLIVAKSVVAPFLAPSKPAAVGTDKGLFHRDYSLASVARLSIGGETYRVRA